MRMILLASFLALPLAGQAQPTSETPVVKPYPLDTCVVSDEAFDGEPKVLVVEGQEIKVCCNKCKKKVLAEPATYLKKIANAQATAPTIKPYPLDTCVVSDEAFDGEPKVLVVEGQEIKVCCNKCKKKVLADPATYLKKIADAKK